jgi:hypothetical protein
MRNMNPNSMILSQISLKVTRRNDRH